MNRIVLGTRGSKLAMAQTLLVKEQLLSHFPGLEVKIEVIHTRGDRINDVPLARLGGKGLFVKEIEEALLDGRCDAAVHSLKDVPSELPLGLVLCAVLPREVPWDAFVSLRYQSISELPKGAVVGTSSLRRMALLREVRPDIEVRPLRGNVDTRLRRLSEGLDAIVLAAAGLRRLGLEDRITDLLKPPDFIPAVGQGVVVVECRENDDAVRAMLKRIEHEDTRTAVKAERAFLATMGGGCQVPLGAYASVEGQSLMMFGMVGSSDGRVFRAHLFRSLSEPESCGESLARSLLDMCGEEVIRRLRELH